MGKKYTPVYATQAITYIEVKLYDNFEEHFGIEAVAKFQKEWMRYLDDCFIYWDTGIGPITELHNILNNLHENIKFAVETNYNKINVLDANNNTGQ